MKKLLFTGGVIFTITLFLIVSNFSINPNTSETSMRSIDLNDPQASQSIDLHQTEVGNQYLKPLKKSVPNSNWEETHIALERTISSDNVQQNVTFDYFSEMPTPSQKVLDRYEEKLKNPKPRKIPIMSGPTSEINPTLDGAINIDEFLDVKKKNLKLNN